MKVILNKDLAPLGEEGDVKEVAKGYARNFLFPRGIAMPYTERTLAILESRRGEIEERKEEKRKGALGIKEKLEELDLLILMPAGANGRLYGAVTSQTVAEELTKQGFEIERKRIELPGNSFKSVGKYKVMIKLYESAAAELGITVEGQQLKVETPSTPARRDRRRREEAAEDILKAAPESPAAPGPIPEAGPAEPAAADDPAAAAPGPAAAAPGPLPAAGPAEPAAADDPAAAAGPASAAPGPIPEAGPVEPAAADDPAAAATGPAAAAPGPIPEAGPAEPAAADDPVAAAGPASAAPGPIPEAGPVEPAAADDPVAAAGDAASDAEAGAPEPDREASATEA
jgi:large subunit ribosomal protein L9